MDQYLDEYLMNILFTDRDEVPTWLLKCWDEMQQAAEEDSNESGMPQMFYTTFDIMPKE